MDGSLAKEYSNCEDYFEYASQALDEMVRQAGEPVFDSRGIMKKGVIVRHLALPGCLADSQRIVEYLYQKYGDSIYFSIMNQYTPVGPTKNHPKLNRRISPEEYSELVDFAVAIGVKNGFIQEGDTALESFIPAFDGEGI